MFHALAAGTEKLFCLLLSGVGRIRARLRPMLAPTLIGPMQMLSPTGGAKRASLSLKAAEGESCILGVEMEREKVEEGEVCGPFSDLEHSGAVPTELYGERSDVSSYMWYPNGRWHCNT